MYKIATKPLIISRTKSIEWRACVYCIFFSVLGRCELFLWAKPYSYGMIVPLIGREFYND